MHGRRVEPKVVLRVLPGGKVADERDRLEKAKRRGVYLALAAGVVMAYAFAMLSTIAPTFINILLASLGTGVALAAGAAFSEAMR